jgi:polar amino acid transport system substrate-binding protein
MLRDSLRLLCLLFVALPLLALSAEPSQTLRLASLVWLPYVGPALPQNGLSTAIADDAARTFGERIQVDYFPWARAMKVGIQLPEYAGYFPAYYTEERARECHFTNPIGKSTLGLAFLKSRPLQWNTLTDLSNKSIGIVHGYSNGEAFDKQIKDGKQKFDVSDTDVINIKKLLGQRIDAAAIDKSVLRYLLATDPRLAGARDLIDFHDKPLAELTLHICFKRTPAGRELKEKFDQALLHIDFQKIESEYFKELERQPSDR